MLPKISKVVLLNAFLLLYGLFDLFYCANEFQLITFWGKWKECYCALSFCSVINISLKHNDLYATLFEGAYFPWKPKSLLSQRVLCLNNWKFCYHYNILCLLIVAVKSHRSQEHAKQMFEVNCPAVFFLLVSLNCCFLTAPCQMWLMHWKLIHIDFLPAQMQILCHGKDWQPLKVPSGVSKSVMNA